MKSRPLVFIAILAVVGSVLWWALRSRPAQVPQGQATTGVEEAGNVRSGPQSSRNERESSGNPPDVAGQDYRASVDRMIRAALAALKKGDVEEADRILAEFEKMMRDKPDRMAAVDAIMDFLNTGEDAPTGKGFVVGEDGKLVEANTLRVYLMDWLGVLCNNSGRGDDVRLAREILQGFGSADEWAISMRNFAWDAPEHREFLMERVNAMIRHPQWQQQPTTGMLEAYDVIVHTGSMEAVPELARQISLPESPVGRASGVALDRLATTHALELTTLLNRQPDLLSATPMVRADLFAHADLAAPEQRAQLETYLLRPDVDAAEREKFFSSLVQTGQFVSHNLITPYVPPEEPAQAAERLGKLVQAVNGWMRDSRFGAISGELSAFGESVNGIIDEISSDEAGGEQK